MAVYQEGAAFPTAAARLGVLYAAPYFRAIGSVLNPGGERALCDEEERVLVNALVPEEYHCIPLTEMHWRKSIATVVSKIPLM